MATWDAYPVYGSSASSGGVNDSPRLATMHFVGGRGAGAQGEITGPPAATRRIRSLPQAQAVK